jgi:hypothetical protein
MYTEPYLKLSTLEDDLWQTALKTAGPIDISPACAESLRAWIAIGVQRMERQHRLAPADLAMAHSNLRKFLDLLKKEAVFLDNPNRLDNRVFHAARGRLRGQAAVSMLTLWPFWPHNFVSTK